MKIKTYIKLAGYFFVDVYGWLRSLIIYCFKSIKRPASFYGYKSYWWASKYAEKRTRQWKSRWDQNGKQQGVFPMKDERLFVCSKLELKFFRKRGLIDKSVSPRKMIRKSYYTTKL